MRSPKQLSALQYYFLGLEIIVVKNSGKKHQIIVVNYSMLPSIHQLVIIICTVISLSPKGPCIHSLSLIEYIYWEMVLKYLGKLSEWKWVFQSCLLFVIPWAIARQTPLHRILQARILVWVAIPFSREFSQLGDRTQVSCIAGRFFTIWATREAQVILEIHIYLSQETYAVALLEAENQTFLWLEKQCKKSSSIIAKSGNLVGREFGQN